LHDDRIIDEMPRLSDYLDLGVELIEDKVEDVTDAADDLEDEEEPLKKSA
jgi:hypothetical protein